MTTPILALCWPLAVASVGIGAPGSDGTGDLRPIAVIVVDRKTGEPVTVFSYHARIDTPQRRSTPRCDPEWITVRSPRGTFVLQGPPSCEVHLGVKSRDALGGFGHGYYAFAVKASDRERRLVVELDLGQTVGGVVRDGQTKRPVAGAKVAPVIATPPGWSPDRERAVTTDGEGRFELHGVDPDLGVTASHPDYLVPWNLPDGAVAGRRPEILLRKGETIRGVVRAPDGSPLEGVEVNDGAGKEVMTDRDGVFVLESPLRWDDNGRLYHVNFSKDGYIERMLSPPAARAEGLAVTLEPHYVLRGRVLTPEGRPAGAFTVVAGPGRNPPDCRCDRRAIRDRAGRFTLHLKEAGTTWVGVRAEGHAAWEGWTRVDRASPPLEVRLDRGVAVTGAIAGPRKPLGGLSVALIPQRPPGDEVIVSGTPARDLATLTTTTTAAGRFRFDHVRPDRYRLRVTGRGITPASREVTVAATGQDLGSLRVAGTGRIVGQVNHPEGGAWAFADGWLGSPALDRSQALPFKADERGRFANDEVPVGRVTISFPHPRSADVIGTYSQTVEVIEGRTTQVRPFRPDPDP